MRAARAVAGVAALFALACHLSAQQGPAAQQAHLVKFFIAMRDSAGPPSPVEPSRVPSLRKRIAIQLDSVPVRVALKKLASLSGLHFIYSDDVVDDDRAVRLRARDITVAAALTEVLVDAAVSVVIRDDGDAVIVPASTSFVPHDTASTVSGLVTDRAGAPVSGAEVYVVTAGRTAQTDSDGRYSIARLLQGPTHLHVEMPGWAPADTEVALAPHGAATQNFVLNQRAAALDAVRVSSVQECPRQSLDGFDCRRRSGLGVFRNTREIEALAPIYFADIFDGVEGIRRIPLPLDEGIEPTTQWRCIVYLENGHVPSWTNVMRINFREIIAFEFYASPESVPTWYRNYAWKGAAPCSLMILWMRGAPEVAK